MECITPLLTCLGSQLAEACGSALHRQVEDGVNSLGGLARKALSDRIQQWRNKVILEPMDATTLVGADETLKAINGHLNGDEVDVVGVVGMGGIGKTTLLKKINNDLYSQGAGKFDIVIFATVSSDGDALKVHNTITERLRLSGGAESGRSIYDSLAHKKYLLLLDDVWRELDLKEIGIPFPNKGNRCKVVLTMRSSVLLGSFLGDWCRPRSRARVVDMKKLDDDRSWELFESMVDPSVDLDDPSIVPHAELMVQKCDGLPLALITMARAMATATAAAEWRKAERQWEESPYRLERMDRVQSNLMFSIDRLEQTTMLPCFLYCSLFPEDCNIPVNELIEYWIGEGLLDGGGQAPRRRGKGIYGSIHHARDEGEIVIKKLKELCLLETGRERGSVKMHDLVREVALLVGRKVPNHVFIPKFNYVSRESDHVMIVDGWEEATRVSLMFCSIEEGSLPETPCCPKLSTLIMLHTKLPEELPDGFFNAMRNLAVLELTYQFPLRTVPSSICSLSELRFLKLTLTNIRSLPRELGNLVKLRQLDLSNTVELETIPQQAISRLSNLQVLNMSRCGYQWGLGGGENNGGVGDTIQDAQLGVSDLHEMDQLQDFSITIRQPHVLDSLLVGRGSLLTSITRLALSFMGRLTTDILRSALHSMTSLRGLVIQHCESLTGELILDCVDQPVLYELEDLELTNVRFSAILVKDDGNEVGGDHFGDRGRRRRRARSGGPLQKLRNLELHHLPELERICGPPRYLPSLELLQVEMCPRLRMLPLGPNSKIKEIYCRQDNSVSSSKGKEWWERLEWRRDQGDARRLAESVLRCSWN